MKQWTIENCDWEGVKILEQVGDGKPEQVAAISMATPDALALMLAAPRLLEGLKYLVEQDDVDAEAACARVMMAGPDHQAALAECVAAINAAGDCTSIPTAKSLANKALGEGDA